MELMKMVKNFYYKIVKSTPRRSGGRNETAEVFKVVRGEIKKLGEVKWCTASTYGETSEVQQFLIKKKLLPKKLGNYYTWKKGEEGKYKIRGL
jgi:hypothetical protein